MNQINKLKSICDRENVKLEVIKVPQYIQPFVLDCEVEIILIRKEGAMPAPLMPLIKLKDEAPEDEFDLTGSPLHTSLDDSLINNPITQAQVNVNEYFNHSPLAVDQATQIINDFTQSGNPTFEEKELPIWVLCDASDESHTALITLQRSDDGWMMRGSAVLAPSNLFLQNLNPYLDAMLQDHLFKSRGEAIDVSYQAKACYTCNKNEVSEMVDEFGDNGASLKIYFSWKRPHTHFNFPPYDSTSYLEMNVTVGCEGSFLWQEIEKLQEINDLMATSSVERENELLMSMVTKNQTVLASSIRNQIHSFISSKKPPPSSNSAKLQGAAINGIAHVLDIYEVVVEGRRPNMDVTEVLWSILKGCNDFIELTSCFKMIIREAASGRFAPKILPDNKTFVAKIIKGAQEFLQTLGVKFSSSDALQWLWEIGNLKLQRDYNYMLQKLEMKSSGLCDVFKGLKESPVVTKQQREEGIKNLVAVHSFIEILMLLRSQLSMDNELLSLLAASVLPKLTSAAQEFAKSSVHRSLDDLDSVLQKMSFTIPLHTKISIPLVKGSNPESWSFSLSTVKNKKEILTVFHQNNDGLFPPGVYPPGAKGEKGESISKENSIAKFTLLGDHLFSRDSAAHEL